MKKPSNPLFSVLLCFLTLAMLSFADTPLEEKMDKMKKAYKELSKSLEKPIESEKEKYQNLAEQLRVLMKESGKLSPEKTETIPADKRAAFIEGYQKAIDQAVVTLDSLILAIKSANWSEAQKLMATLKNQQKEGHKEFRSQHP